MKKRPSIAAREERDAGAVPEVLGAAPAAAAPKRTRSTRGRPPAPAGREKLSVYVEPRHRTMLEEERLRRRKAGRPASDRDVSALVREAIEQAFGGR